MEFDFIIVGQGIAGSVLSVSLMKEGYTVCVINNSDLSSCSSVAAGIWNPVVFKRLTKSWLADEVVPELNSFYSYAETLFDAPLIQQRAIIKSFTEEQEKTLWIKKAESDNSFLDKHLYSDLKLSANSYIHSYSKVLRAGNLHVTSFLEHTKHYLAAHAGYLNERFDYTQLKDHTSFITYKSVSAKHIIFCEGHLISANPAFSWIPMKPAKGEIITIECEGLELKKDILNKGIFILPLSENTYKVGATYEWENLNDTPTEKAKAELTHKLDSIINVPYKIIKHEAGIRPAVTDRRPVVGKHPHLNHHFVFNGFGTKAVMLAPYFANRLISSIRTGNTLNPEVDPLRFYKK